MRKEVTTRMNRVMELIVYENCKTLREIADIMKISLRQLRYDVSQINDMSNQGGSIIETNKRGQLIINDMESLKELLSKQEKQFKCSRSQRVDYINIITAFNAKVLNLNNLTRELNVTRVTVKTDLNEVKNMLHKYNLKLAYDNYFFLSGNEEDIFEFRLEALRLLEYALYKENFEKIELLIQEVIFETFPEVKLRDILPILSNFIKENNIFIKDSEFFWLATTILLMLWYNYNGYAIPGERHLNVTKVDFKYDNLFIALEDFMKIKLSESDQGKIKNAISTVCNQEICDVAKVNVKIIEFIYRLINSFSNQYREIFTNDEFLLAGVYNHLERCWKKNTAELDIDIKEQYQNYLSNEINDMIDNFCENNNELIELENHQEKELLKLHFANSIYHHYKLVKKKALIVSGVSKFAKKQLKTTLESMFEIEIIDMISRYDIPFYQQWDNLDIILFTEDIPEYFTHNIPAIKINIILDNDDFIKLNELGIVLKEQSLDLYELYKQLEFLGKENQVAAIETINDYFQKKGRLTNRQVGYNIDYQVKQVDNLKIEDGYIKINDRTKVLFQLSNCNLIEVMDDNNQLTIKINGVTPVVILFLLFNCSERLEMINSCKNDSEKVVELLSK